MDFFELRKELAPRTLAAMRLRKPLLIRAGIYEIDKPNDPEFQRALREELKNPIYDKNKPFNECIQQLTTQIEFATGLTCMASRPEPDSTFVRLFFFDRRKNPKNEKNPIGAYIKLDGLSKPDLYYDTGRLIKNFNSTGFYIPVYEPLPDTIEEILRVMKLVR